MRKVEKKRVNSPSKRKDKPTYNGIIFDSGLEVYCYKQLEKNDIEFKYEPTSFVLQIPFVYPHFVYESDKKRGVLLHQRTPKYQSISYTPDFVGKDWIIETKGVATDRFKIVWKLFKKYLTDNNFKFDLYLPKNQKQVDQCIELIQSKNNMDRIIQKELDNTKDGYMLHFISDKGILLKNKLYPNMK